MSMTKREKILAIGVGCVVGLVVLQLGFSKLIGNIRVKEDAVDAARSKVDKLQTLVTTGKIANKKLEQLRTKSLPSNPEYAMAQYRNWLLKLGNECKLTNISVNQQRKPSTAKSYQAYGFTLTGECTMESVVELLANYYDKDYLHGIHSLKLSPTKERGVMSLTLDSTAISLLGAGAQQPVPTEASGRLAFSVDGYKEAILNRNPFSLPNQPPKFVIERSHDVTVGSRWSLSLKADDPDGNAVDYEVLTSDLPKGLRYERGSLNWQPEEKGTYEVTVRATDRGWPRKSAEQKLAIRVVDPPARPEPPAPKPQYDVAKQAFVSAMVRGKNGPEVWIRSRTDGKTYMLSIGDQLEIGSVKATVIDINLTGDFIEFESDGIRWTIGMDQSVADAFTRSQID